MENIFALPPMAVIKYHRFLEVKPKYEMNEVRQSNLSFAPDIWEDQAFYFVKATDFLFDEKENDVDMIVPNDAFTNTIQKAESIRFMEQFKKEIIWSLQSKEV